MKSRDSAMDKDPLRTSVHSGWMEQGRNGRFRMKLLVRAKGYGLTQDELLIGM